MELGLTSCNLSRSVNAAESTVEVVDRFLNNILEKIAMNIEDLRLKQPNAKPKIGGTSTKFKQVHFSSPLVTASHSEPENEQSQDTLILTPEDYDYEDAIDACDSEDEMRRKFIEEGESFVPEMTSPIKQERKFEFGSLFYSKFLYQNQHESSQNLAVNDKSARIIALDREGKNPCLTATIKPETIFQSTFGFSDSFSVVPGRNTFRSNENREVEVKTSVEFDVDLQQRHTSEKKAENCLGLQREFSFQGCLQAEKRVSDGRGDEKLLLNPVSIGRCLGKMREYPQIPSERQDIDLRNKEIDSNELVLDECKMQFEKSGSKVQEAVDKIIDFKTEIESSEPHSCKPDVLKESEENCSVKTLSTKRKITEAPALICNDADSCIDLDWQAKVRKKKSKPSCFNINELKEELESCDQLDMKPKTGDLCSRPVVDCINIEDQLVPDVATDATKHSSTAEVVLSNLDPQPYPMSIFGASCPSPLQEYKNVFATAVPDCQGLEHFTQADKSLGSPKLANQNSGEIHNATADLDAVIDGSESSSIEVVLFSGGEAFLADSVDVCDDASVLKQSEYMDNVELNPEEELKVNSVTASMRLEGELKVASAKIGSVFKEIVVYDAVDSKNGVRDREKIAVDNSYGLEEQVKKSKKLVNVSQSFVKEEQVEEILEPVSLVKKMKLGGELDARCEKESKGNDKKEDRVNCEEQDQCLNLAVLEFGKEEAMKVKNIVEDAVDMNGGEEQSKLQEKPFAVVEEIKKGTSTNSMVLQKNRSLLNAGKWAENESREVVRGEYDEEEREHDENSPSGSEGFEIHFTPCEISIQIERELQSAQNMLVGEYPQGDPESIIHKKCPTRRDICEKIEGVVDGINTDEQDQTIEMTPTFEYNDIKFYDEDMSRKPQSSFPRKQSFNNSLEIISHEVENGSSINLVEGVPSNSSAFSWSASGKALWKSVQDTSTSLQGPQTHSISNEATFQRNSQPCRASSKRAPSQSIIRLGLSKRTRMKRLHPYFTKDRIKDEKQLVPNA